MIVAARGCLSQGRAGSDRAALTFPAITALASGGLIAPLRAGPTRDDDGAVIVAWYAGAPGRMDIRFALLTAEGPASASPQAPR